MNNFIKSIQLIVMILISFSTIFSVGINQDSYKGSDLTGNNLLDKSSSWGKNWCYKVTTSSDVFIPAKSQSELSSYISSGPGSKEQCTYS